MDRTAIIVGSNGQDGMILQELLSKNGYKYLGLDRNKIESRGIKWRKIVNINSQKEVFVLIKKIKPKEVYYLAAFHHSSEDKNIDDQKMIEQSYQINFFSYVNFLEAVKKYSPKTRIFYAASSMIFGNSQEKKQDENSSFAPENIYGLTKLNGLLISRYYRKKYNLFVSVGIFYNHESIYREEKFLFKKIVQGAVDIKAGKKKEILIGNLGAEVDWGYAPDYMEAIYKILNISCSDDFIIATGKKHSVKELTRTAFSYLGLRWQGYVKEDKNLGIKTRKALVGDARKLRKKTGWKPSVNFSEMVKKVIDQISDKK